MELSTAGAVAAIDGVDVAVPSVTVLWDDEVGGGFWVPDQIVGQVAGADKGHENFVLNYAQGRAITEADEGSNVVVLGSDLARKYSLKAGDTVPLRGVDFEVVGVLEPTLTAPDSTAIVPLLASQQLYYETLPPIVRERLEPADLISQVTVYPSAGADIDALAKTIEATVPNTADADRRRVRQPGRLGHRDLQRDHHRRRADQPRRRWPVGHQHDGDVGRRANP